MNTLGWHHLENFYSIQLIPENEEELHALSYYCECRPSVAKRNWDDKLIYCHTAFDKRNELDDAFCTIYHTVRQRIDC